MKEDKIIYCHILVLLLIVSCKGSLSNKDIYSIKYPDYYQSVKLEKINNYYRVIIDESVLSPFQAGEALGYHIKRKISDYPTLVDSYLAEHSLAYKLPIDILTARANEIKKQLDKKYIDEIEGLAVHLVNSKKSILGDKRLSFDELLIVNLIPDIMRIFSCSAFSVYGMNSKNGNTITGRNLDWPDGSQGQLSKISAVKKIISNDNNIITIGYLGFLGVITGFNEHGVFAGILDSQTNDNYLYKGKYSYPFEIRNALEKYTSVDEMAKYLISHDRHFTFGHLVFLSDQSKSIVVENDTFPDNRRIRTSLSKLNNHVKAWPVGFGNSIGAVNSYILKDSFDNHSKISSNVMRWDTMIIFLKDTDIIAISKSDIKNLMTYNGVEGALFVNNTNQVIIFEPKTLSLEVYFKNSRDDLPNEFVFNKIEFFN